MYLVFRATQNGIAFATIDGEGSVMAHDSWELANWTSQSPKKIKEALVHSLRVQGRVFHAIGYVLPFGDSKSETPSEADGDIIKSLATNPLHDTLLKPSRLLYDIGRQLWPHLPHYFLFDTHLSPQLPKHLIVPGLSDDTSAQFSFHPRIMRSYGHRANLYSVKEGQKCISLYIDQTTSIALFDGAIIKDAIVSYSPLPAVVGFTHLGALDAGTTLTLYDGTKPHDRLPFLLTQTGLGTQLEGSLELESALQIAGLIPRKDLGFMDRLEIETIEWTELSVKSFVRSLRHAIASMLASDGAVRTLVVNTSYVPEKSSIWKLLVEGSLCQLKVVFSDTLDLEAAGEDLIESHTA